MERAIGRIHIARKAGKLLLGRTAVLDGLKSGGDLLVLMASDMGADLEKRLGLAEKVETGLSADELGRIFNREKLAVMAVTDRGLAESIKTELMKKPIKGSPQASGLM